MSDNTTAPSNDSLKLRKRALARSDNEGRAKPNGLQAASAPVEGEAPMPENGRAEIATLHVRVIALENLLISLLATASERQLKLAGEMAAYITPRPGFTHPALTTQAATHMIDLVERASRFRDGKPT